jgi:hypothetical protein
MRAIRAERGEARGLGLTSGGGRGCCALSATVVAMETREAQRDGRCVGRGRTATRRERRTQLGWGEEEVTLSGGARSAEAALRRGCRGGLRRGSWTGGGERRGGTIRRGIERI